MEEENKEKSSRKKKPIKTDVEEKIEEVIEEPVQEENNNLAETQEEITQLVDEETKEDIKQEDEINTQDTVIPQESVVEEKPKNKVSIVTIILALICVTLAIILITSKFGSKTIKLNDYSECFVDKNASFKLPNKYLFAEDGTIFENNNGILTVKGTFVAAESNDEDFQYIVDMIAEGYGGEQKDMGNFKAVTFSQEIENGKFVVYCLYKDSIIAEFQFLNIDDGDIASIVSSLNY